MLSHSTIYLIPSPLSYPAPIFHMPAYYVSPLMQCKALCVENLKTARKFLKSLDTSININAFDWIAIHKNAADYMGQIELYLNNNENIGIISDAGCPAIADPGQKIVAKGHEFGAKIMPLIGGSSIVLALMASGLNGQNFSFIGYLPITHEQKIQTLKKIENISYKTGQTQIFIETPYRNEILYKNLLTHCRDTTHLCLATDLTGSNEKIQTLPIKIWKKINHTCPKIPTVFLLNAASVY